MSVLSRQMLVHRLLKQNEKNVAKNTKVVKLSAPKTKFKFKLQKPQISTDEDEDDEEFEEENSE